MLGPLDATDDEIYDAMKRVQDESSPTNWCLFGYVPKTSRLKLLADGEGDVSELADEVSDSKLHFGYLRKEMSETWKYVLIAWCGEGVPSQVKGHFTRHTQDMENFCHKNNFIYSALISARSESDLDEAEIVKALNKTSTFVRARTTKEKPAESLKDVRNRYWNKQSEVDAQHTEYLNERRRQREEEAAASRSMMEAKLQRDADEILSQREAERQAEVEELKRTEEERTRAQEQHFTEQRKRIFDQMGSREAPAADAGYSAAPAPSQPPRPLASRAPAPAAAAAPAPAPAASSWDTEPEAAAEAPAAEAPHDDSAAHEEETPAEGGGEGGGGSSCKALYDYAGEAEGDLSFNEGDIIALIDTSDPSGWWVGELNGVQGTFPSNFVELC